MKNGKKTIIGGILTILLVMIAATIIINSQNRLNATIPGKITAGRGTKVYKKPNLKSGLIKKDGKTITLLKGASVNIVKSSKDFYYIDFSIKKENFKGYVLKKNVAPVRRDASNEAVSVNTQTVGGNIYGDTYLYTTTSSLGSVTLYNEKEVLLKEGDSINIESATYASGVKWYKVIYANNGNPVNGFVPARLVNVRTNGNTPATIYTSGFAIMEKEPGTNIFTTVNGDTVELEHETPIEIIESTVKDEYRYDKIRVLRGDNEVIGYVADDMVRINIIPLKFDDNPTEADLFGDNGLETVVAPRKTPKKKAKKVTKINKKKKPKVLTNIAFRNKLKKEGFPDSYIDSLVRIHEKYPYWEFEAYKTGLDFNEVVEHESVIGLNLVTNDKPDSWKSKEPGAYNKSTKTYIPYDGGKWVNVSETTLRYYLDPRNFLNPTQIFQFENLSYQSATQNVRGLENMLKGTPMYKTRFNYTEGGKNRTITYSKTFMDAAKKSGVSPYHLVARVKQEVVTSPSSFSSSVSNTSGYYNFYNIGASNSNLPGGAISKGLAFAAGSDGYFRPWNNRYRAIVGGGLFIGQNYINVGQDTLYLQKFNVTDTGRYSHQYMGNIEAPASEAVKTVSAYGGSMKNMNIVFSIPIYNNLPRNRCPAPKGGTVYGKVQVNIADTNTADTNNDISKIVVRVDGINNTIIPSSTSNRVFKINVSTNARNAVLKAVTASQAAELTGTGRKVLSARRNIYYLTCISESGRAKKYKIIIVKKNSSKSNKRSKVSTRGSVELNN